MARIRRPHRTAQGTPQIKPEEPAPPPPVDEPSFDSLSDEVPGLDDLPPTDAELAAESSPEAEELTGNVFDPAPIEPSPPSWEGDITPPALEPPPSTGDVIEGLMAEITQLRSAAEIREAALQDATSEVTRQHETLAELSLEVASTLVKIDDLISRVEEGTLRIDQLGNERDDLERRLVDSELTRADLESQLDVMRLKVGQLEAAQVDRKLWQVFSRKTSERMFIAARSITEAIERAIENNFTTAEDIANVAEFKIDRLVL